MLRRLYMCFLALVLCGCAGRKDQMEQAMEFRTALLNANGCGFRIQATADFSDRTYSFEMECETDREGNLQFSVLEPEYISGISGTIQYDSGNIIFDDVVFGFPLQNEGYLAPVAGPWVMVRALRSGYIRYSGIEEGLLRITVDDSYEEDALTLDIWFNEDGVPIQADVFENQRRILSFRVENFRLL